MIVCLFSESSDPNTPDQLTLDDRPPEVDALLVPEPAPGLAELHDEVDLGEAVHAGQLASGLSHATTLLETKNYDEMFHKTLIFLLT